MIIVYVRDVNSAGVESSFTVLCCFARSFNVIFIRNIDFDQTFLKVETWNKKSHPHTQYYINLYNYHQIVGKTGIKTKC